MVIRTRRSVILLSLTFYVISGCIGGYFVWHAINGERGLKNRVAYKAKIAQLEVELSSLREDRTRLERRARMLQVDSLDRDLLDEEARNILGRAQRSEVVVFAPNP